MGAGASTATGSLGSIGLTRSDILKSTDTPRLLINKLFSFFADKFAQKDLLALGNPTRCSEYIFVMADALDRLFYELRIVPGKDKKGVLLFRKAADITRPTPESVEGQQRKTLCLSLAFFYIRIFQIYAALALTVVDDASYGTSSGFNPDVSGAQGAMVAPWLSPTYQGGGGQGTTRAAEANHQTGGSTEDNILKFAILKHYVTRDYARPAGYYMFDNYQNVVINVKSETKNLTLYKTNPQAPGPFSITCNFSIRVVGLDRTKRMVTFSNFKSAEMMFSSSLKTHGPFGFIVKNVGDHRYETDKGDEAIDALIYRVLVTATEVSVGARPPQRIRMNVGAPGAMGTTGAATSYNVGIPEGLKTTTILTALKKVPKPLAHCVARSLQLLNVDALSAAKLPTEVRSSICKMNFDTAHGGIATVGKPVTDAPGMAALYQLFFDRIDTGKPSMSEDATATYQSFVRKMAEQYGEGASVAQTSHLTSIINRTDKMCGPSKKDKVLLLQTNQKAQENAVRVAQQAIQTLWKFQIAHDQEVLKILSNLVTVTRAPGGGGVRIGLNPLIIQTGNPGVAILAKQARELLVKYYSNCEEAFRIAAVPLASAASSAV